MDVVCGTQRVRPGIVCVVDDDAGNLGEAEKLRRGVAPPAGDDLVASRFFPDDERAKNSETLKRTGQLVEATLRGRAGSIQLMHAYQANGIRFRHECSGISERFEL